MKKIAISFLALTMSIVGVSPSVALAAGSAELTLSPTNTSVETGDTFSLSVLVDPNGESLDTARVELDWDASKLEVLSFDLGSLFPYLSPSNEIDNTNGDLSYGAFKFGTPVTSSGTLATVTFHALASGSTTISVSSSSKLISDGEEKIDTSALGSSAITISGEAVESEATEDTTSEEEEESTTSSSGTSDGTEADALAYFGALFGFLPSTDDEWDTLHCIASNDCYDENNRNLTYEVAALAQFNSKYGANPSTGMDWNAVHALAYTDVGMELLGISVEVEEEEEVVVEEEEEEVSYVDESLSLEQQALVYFGAFYARMPSSGDDWEALHCIAYGGCQGDPRDLQAEQDALVLFGAKYAKMPSTDMEWNVLHTIAYTDLLTWDEQGSEEEAVEETVVEETQEEDVVVEEETELSVEEQAIGWFGKITGYLPSSDADWTAVDYMVNGYTPETQDLEVESTAITTFVSVFGALPSSDQDWNIVAAIAYSGAF